MEPLEDLEDYEYLVKVACAVLGETDAAFRIGGFGRDDWSFDVGYDMSAFVEELPRLIDSLHSGRETEIDLYPQGVERTLTFSPVGEEVRITCVSRTSWVPRPDTEVCPAEELMGMCVRLAHDFADAVAAVAPSVARLASFDRRLRGEV
jgi:hypothetical protein